MENERLGEEQYSLTQYLWKWKEKEPSQVRIGSIFKEKSKECKIRRERSKKEGD